jgi:hypothetical protein
MTSTLPETLYRTGIMEHEGENKHKGTLKIHPDRLTLSVPGKTDS